MLRKFKHWLNPVSGISEPGILFESQPLHFEQMVCQLRRATSDDIEALLAIERACYDGQMPWNRFAFLNELRKTKQHLYLVVEQEGQVIAFIGSWFSLAEAHITNFAVDPQYQNQHLGRQLLQVMEKTALDFGSDQLSLEVRANNEAAKHLYRSFGFKDGAIKKAYYTLDHEDALDMWKQI